MKKILFISIITLFGFFTCVEPFEPDIEKYDDMLVVEGFISNEEIPYTVKLTRSFKAEEKEGEKISGATVMIISSEGEEEVLQEKSENSGIYTTVNKDFIGKYGVEYKVSIQIGDERFESEFEVLQEAPEIDSLYYSYEEKQIFTENGSSVLKGITINIDTYKKENEGSFYQWEYEETWRFQTKTTKPGFEDKQICYANSRSQGFIIGSISQNRDNALIGEDIYFIDNYSDRLNDRYTTEIKQYCINESAYQFYKLLKEQEENVGSLFDKIPISIKGNVKSISSDQKAVLGMFRVAGVKKKRIFIDNDDIKDLFAVYANYDYCTIESIAMNDPLIRNYFNNYIPIDTLSMDNQQFVRFANTVKCYDCTQLGFPATPPNFWED